MTEIANIQESYSVEVGERLLITPELQYNFGLIRTIWIIRGIIKAVRMECIAGG